MLIKCTPRINSELRNDAKRKMDLARQLRKYIYLLENEGQQESKEA